MGPNGVIDYDRVDLRQAKPEGRVRRRPRHRPEPDPPRTPGAARPSRRRAPNVSSGTDPRTLPSEDRATYNCGCGFVFSHDVSTSVACPHCGDTQAW